MRRLLIAANWLAPALFVAGACTGLFWAGLAAMASIHGFTLWASLVPSCHWWSAQSRRFRTEKKEVWLTLDDGPDPLTTRPALAALAQAGARATFFVIGEKAERHPDLVQAILDGGHQLANHTWTHPQWSFWIYPARWIERELTRTSALLEAATGNTPALFRSPAGMKSAALAPVLARLNLHLVHWSARGLDGRDTSVLRILNRVIQGLEPGAILLLHEGRPSLLETLPALLAEGTRRGFTFVLPEKKLLTN